MISPSSDAVEALRAHGLDDNLIEVATAMASDIEDAADDVAGDTRSAAFDDSTSRGQLLHRRARNRIIARYKDNVSISCDTTDNALHIRSGQVALSFYSAREGLEHPKVSGSRTKRRVVDESQMTLNVGDRVELRRLVLLHEASDDGLVRVGVGVLASSTEWSWNICLYDRYATDAGAESKDQRAAYDQLPEPDLPELSPRRRDRTEADAAE
jgi:hypothetical protein